MSDVCRRVDTTGQLSDPDREEILKVAKEFLEKYKAENPQKRVSARKGGFRYG